MFISWFKRACRKRRLTDFYDMASSLDQYGVIKISMGKVGGLVFIQFDHPKWEAQRYNRYDTVKQGPDDRHRGSRSPTIPVLVVGRNLLYESIPYSRSRNPTLIPILDLMLGVWDRPVQQSVSSSTSPRGVVIGYRWSRRVLIKLSVVHGNSSVEYHARLQRTAGPAGRGISSGQRIAHLICFLFSISRDMLIWISSGITAAFLKL